PGGTGRPGAAGACGVAASPGVSSPAGVSRSACDSGASGCPGCSDGSALLVHGDIRDAPGCPAIRQCDEQPGLSGAPGESWTWLARILWAAGPALSDWRASERKPDVPARHGLARRAYALTLANAVTHS